MIVYSEVVKRGWGSRRDETPTEFEVLVSVSLRATGIHAYESKSLFREFSESLRRKLSNRQTRA